VAAALEADRQREEDAGQSAEPSAFAALPEAVYKPSRLALETPSRGQGRAPALPKCFDKVDRPVEATVVKHVARERVPANMTPGSKLASSLKVQPPRESDMGQQQEASMIEMSIREVKKVVM